MIHAPYGAWTKERKRQLSWAYTLFSYTDNYMVYNVLWSIVTDTKLLYVAAYNYLICIMYRT
ncbi:MAG TPA: hypothetical protein DCX82_13715 [Lachnospiraceae bacterium]|nr:hypothetical protein [Lachnospiraceae bacterium]